LKEYLIENCSSDLATPALSRLYSQMGEVPKGHIVAHGGTPGVERSITKREKELLHLAADDLFSEFVFSGASLPKDSSLGLVYATNDPLIRAKVISSGVDLHYGKHPELEFTGARVSDWQMDMLNRDLFYSPTMSIERRQADVQGKVRKEWFVDGSFRDVDNTSALGSPWQTCRRRRPQAPDGRLGFNSVLIQGIWTNTVARYPSMLKFTAPHDNAKFIEKAISEMRSANSNARFRLIGFDGVGWEKFLTTEAFRATHEAYDKIVGPYGWTRNLINAPTMDGSNQEGILNVSGPESYQYTDDLGYGTRSGLFTVAQLNQVGACAATQYLLERALGTHFTLSELNGGPRVRLFSKGDDNMLLFSSDADADAFKRFKGTVMGIELEFEEYSDDSSYSAANFLAVQYRLEGDPSAPTVRYIKTGDSYLTNLLCSEGGQILPAAVGYWVRSGNRTKAMPSGFGYLARLADYASNDLVFQHDELLRKGLRDIFSLNWWDVFPCRDKDFDLSSELMDDEPSINAVEALLKIAPEAVFKRRLAHSDLTEKQLEKYFLYFSPSWFEQFAAGDLPTAGRPPVVQREHYTAREREAALSWLAERHAEYKRSGAQLVVPDLPEKAKPVPTNTNRKLPTQGDNDE
jgi:hypothetical protein